jgi:hypothetical protein
MDDLGKSIPAAEAMVDAEQEGKPKRHNENCLNCGTPLIDTYCHRCGQKDIPRRQTLGDMLINFISSFWSYEGKFFRTTRYIITSPGFLAAEYNAGRRESYYHPARMYVFMSFLFFFIYFSIPDEDDLLVINETNTETLDDLRKELKESGVDSLVQLGGLSDSALLAMAPAIQDSLNNRYTNGITLESSDYETVAQYDSAELAKPADERHGWLMRKIKIRTIELNQRYKGKSDAFKSEFTAMFKDNFSKVLFWLLPFFALSLKLLYIRRDFYYSEHLVQTIYYYNLFYLAGSIVMILGLIPGLGFAETIIGFWIYFYLLFAMKKLYGQTWGKTILKFAVFSFIFSLFLIAGFAVLAFSIILFL